MCSLIDGCHELKVDLCALNVRSYEAQMNVYALDDGCHELEVDLCASMVAATKLR
jgi:hypothetical protein